MIYAIRVTVAGNHSEDEIPESQPHFGPVVSHIYTQLPFYCKLPFLGTRAGLIQRLRHVGMLVQVQQFSQKRTCEQGLPQVPEQPACLFM